MIRAHNGRRHARAATVPPRIPFRKILADALFWSIAVALIAGLAYWSAVRWVDVFTTTYSPMIVTDTYYITFTE